MFELRAESAVSKGGLMRTLYYVNAGASWFGFYLDEGALALANDGAPIQFVWCSPGLGR